MLNLFMRLFNIFIALDDKYEYQILTFAQNVYFAIISHFTVFKVYSRNTPRADRHAAYITRVYLMFAIWLSFGPMSMHTLLQTINITTVLVTKQRSRK